jgi:hypothetical protein
VGCPSPTLGDAVPAWLLWLYPPPVAALFLAGAVFLTCVYGWLGRTGRDVWPSVTASRVPAVVLSSGDGEMMGWRDSGVNE